MRLGPAEKLPPFSRRPGAWQREDEGDAVRQADSRTIDELAATKQAEVMENDVPLATEKLADKPSSLTPFYRWQSPIWKALAVR